MKNSINKEEIHVWAANAYDFYENDRHFYNLLSDDERERADQFFYEEHKRNFILSRGILRKIIGSYLFVSPEKIKFSYGKYGKPYVFDFLNNKFYFNIAHSKNLVLYVFSKDFPVGVDIQKIEHCEDYEDLFKNLFCSGEILSLEAIPLLHRLEYFFKYWTHKEAFIKMIGYGFHCPMDQFEISLIPGGPSVLCYVNKKFSCSAEKITLKDLDLYPGYAAALAFKGHCRNIQFLQYRI